MPSKKKPARKQTPVPTKIPVKKVPVAKKAPAPKKSPPKPEEQPALLQKEIGRLQDEVRGLVNNESLLREANRELTQRLQESEAEKIDLQTKLAAADDDKNGMRAHLVGEIEEVRERLQKEIGELRATLGQPVRRRMPATRKGLTHKFSIGGNEGYILTGMFEDGSLGELFIEVQKEGSTIGGMMDTIGILTSMALQYGVPLESMARKFAYQRYEPSGYTGNADIPLAFSITDYVFRWLALQFIPGFKQDTLEKGETIIPELDRNTLPG